MAHARIGKITMKAGGAEVRVLHNPLAGPDGPGDHRGQIVEFSRSIAEKSEPDSELIGFVTIGLFSDGTTSLGCRFDPKTSPVPRALLPSFIAEILRRDLVTAAEAEDVACHVVNRAHGFED